MQSTGWLWNALPEPVRIVRLRKRPLSRRRGGALRFAGALIAVLPLRATCEEGREAAWEWRRHGREAFLDFLVASGCEECAALQADSHMHAKFQISSQQFGCADVDVLLPSLHWIYEATRRQLHGALPGLLVDGGANVGRATARWMAALGDAFGRRMARNATQAPCIICAGADATEGGVSSIPTVVVAAVEPSDGNFALLQRHADEGAWREEGFLAMQAALGDRPGEATLAVSKDFAIDEVATLLFSADDKRERQHVRVITLDDVMVAAEDAFPGLGLAERGIFLLKLDIEGLEPAVLRSLRLSKSAVKFVTFEYAANVWQENLGIVVADLFRNGLFCFVMTAERLYPVSGPFWDTIYELPMWSNFVCGHESDPDLEALVQLHIGAVGPWPRMERTYLPGFAAGDQSRYSLLEAQHRCIDLDRVCAGVTCDASRGSCTVREGIGGIRRSPENEVSFLRDVAGADLFLRYRQHAFATRSVSA